MEFTFSDEQEQLRAAVRDLLEREARPDYVRRMIDDPVGVTDVLWHRLVELGWTSLLIPVEHGGLGMGLVDLLTVQEEMGRLPFPGPFFSSSVLATLAASRLGLHGQLVSLATGHTRGTVALDEEGHGHVVDRVRTRGSRKSGHWRLHGHKPVVLDGHTADWVLVVARTQDGLSTFIIDQPGEKGLATMVPTWDPTRKVARLALDGAIARPVGPEGDQSAIWHRVVDDACVALCGELIGVMESANSLAVEYAKDRVQFDRPIATFQVIKHKAADMLHRLEMARVGTHYAAWASDTDDPVRSEAAAMAKAFAGEAANLVTAECIQIHGGVGFTWDCDAHLFYKRAKQDDLLLGYHGIHRQRVADTYLG